MSSSGWEAWILMIAIIGLFVVLFCALVIAVMFGVVTLVHRLRDQWRHQPSPASAWRPWPGKPTNAVSRGRPLGHDESRSGASPTPGPSGGRARRTDVDR